jgi:glycosyltransferase involved in cell wall biosynthesis
LLTPERDASDVRNELAVPSQLVLLGTSGNLRSWKRVDLAVKAVDLAGGNAGLIVIGDGPERGALENLASSLGISDRVRFTGKTSNVADYLQVLDIFVLPSGPEESFGNSAVEAMGFGLPTIVMSDGGGLTEHVEHGRTGVVANDVDDLSRWIARLVEDEPERRRLGEAARATVRERYTTLNMLQGYEHLYAGAGRGNAIAGATVVSPETGLRLAGGSGARQSP